jgi:NitT/TauT family transport system substrate-binding protein
MPIQSRRRFMASATAAATLIGSTRAHAGEGPPETTAVRLRHEDAPPSLVNGVPDTVSCFAPLDVAGELLAAEGFTDIRHVPVKNGLPVTQAFERSEIDFSFGFAPGVLRRVDAGVPITVLAGIHSGCFELFAHQSVRTFTDLKGKQVGLEDALGSPDHLYVSMMAAHVGLDPNEDIKWVTTDDVAHPIELFIKGRIDAYLAFVSAAQPARSAACSWTWRGTGHGPTTSAA